jgi:hypothetical protein
MQASTKPDTIKKALDAIVKKTNRDELKTMKENARAINAQELVDACDKRLAELTKSDLTTRQKAATAKGKAAKATSDIRYRGAFRTELIQKLKTQPGKCLFISLHLAKEVDGQERGCVSAQIRLDDNDNVIVEDLDKKTRHSSLSDLRGQYSDKGGGTDSWGGFKTKDGAFIADWLGVDKALAHDSLGT